MPSKWSPILTDVRSTSHVPRSRLIVTAPVRVTSNIWASTPTENLHSIDSCRYPNRHSKKRNVLSSCAFWRTGFRSMWAKLPTTASASTPKKTCDVRSKFSSTSVQPLPAEDAILHDLAIVFRALGQPAGAVGLAPSPPTDD